MNYYSDNSRLTKKEEKKAVTKLFLAITGTIALLIFIIFMGIPALINLAIFISNIKGEGDIPVGQQNLPLPPPSLELPWEATNTATINIKGSGLAGTTITLYINGDSYKKLLIPKEGNFSFESIPLVSGKNQIWGIIENSTHQKSGRSAIFSVLYKKDKPKFDITEPADGAAISNDTKNVIIKGQTEDGVNVTINDRVVIVDSAGNFSYTLPLNDGENKIVILGTDEAGNVSKIERKVTYSAP